MRKGIRILIFICFVSIFNNRIEAQVIVSNQLIWKGNDYAAFTSLVYYKGAFYCAFRNANLHYDISGEDCGEIVIIRSNNGEKWEEYLVFSDEGFDLRDPQLTITPDNKILLLTEKVKYNNGKVLYRGSCTAYFNENKKYTSLSPIVYTPNLNSDWLWNITWIDGVAYGFTYCPCFSFVKSHDGKNYQILESFEFDGLPTEASIIKWTKACFIAIIRRNRGTALLGIYDKHINEWTWKELKEKIGCPHLIKVDGKILLIGRSYGKKNKTTIFRFIEDELSFEKVIDLERDGADCAYPGAVYRKGILYVSYYSGDGKKSDIYMAQLSFKKRG